MSDLMITDMWVLGKQGLLILLLAGCAPSSAVTITEPVTTTSTTTTLPSTTTTATTTTTLATTTTASGFTAEILSVSAQDLGSSWRPGCPVGPEQLVQLDVSHYDLDGVARQGVVIVHVDWADAVVGVFNVLFVAGFPIERMEPISVFDADDDTSMAANNTSAFNCRPVAGTNRWSEHSYGRAIDINPLLNPYVRGSQVDPPGGREYIDRDPSVPGLIVDNDVVVDAFAAIGWGWGGHWSSAKDYQHFSSTGR